MATALKINGKTHQVDLPDDVPLLWVLRDEVGLTGTKFGCGVAACGACTVHIDGEAVRSCQVALSDVWAISNEPLRLIYISPEKRRK